jgi:hypothetical protein
MSIPLPYVDQYECRSETLEVYASDRRGQVLYQFNNYGYRNNIDYVDDEANAGVYIGSSITAGIGVDWDKSFASLSSQVLNVNCYHFAQGCVMVDNQEILRMLKLVKQSGINAKYYVIQFIQLSRQYDAATGQTQFSDDVEQNTIRFQQVFDQVQELLKNDVWCFLGCDEQQHQLPESITKHPCCLTWNPQFIDFAGVGRHPGVKWHRMISQGLAKFLKKQTF